MNIFSKLLLAALLVSLTLPVALAITPVEYPDFELTTFELIPCTNDLIQREVYGVNTSNPEGGLVAVAEDGTYFDHNNNIFMGMERTYCSRVTITNVGGEVFYPEEHKYDDYRRPFLDLSFYLPESKDSHYLSGQTLSFADSMGIGESYTIAKKFDIFLSETDEGKFCVDASIDQIHDRFADPNVCNQASVFEDCHNALEFGYIQEEDEENNISTLCFDIDEYPIPAAVEGLRFVEADSGSVIVEWDPVSGANSYNIRSFNITPGRDWEEVERIEIDGTKATLYLENDDLFSFEVYALIDDIRGPRSTRFTYNRALPRFVDVPVSSWYYPYLPELQASEIITGYADAAGNLTGNFGPADNLTVAESLKIAYKSIFKFNYNPPDLSDVQVPENLVGHWAEEFFKAAMVKELSIIVDPVSFDPDRKITRAEFVNLFFEFDEKYIPQFDEYTLSDIAYHEYRNQIQLALGIAAIDGYPDQTFRPDALINRAEIVKIVSNLR